MAEYYGYAERDANSYVDWGKLGQNLTETVQAAYKLREERKAELDKLMQENYAEVANSPTGLNQDINGATAKYVDDTKRFLLQANKMLKAGILQPKDYMLINQNLSEDTKALYSNVKNWQTAWAKIQDDVITNKGSSAMLDIASQVASFGKFKDLDLMINPVTGRLNASKMNKGPNGELIKGESLSMQQLNVLMNQDIPRYDLTATLKKNEEALGTFINSDLVKGAIQKQGSIINVEDKAVKNTFTAAKEGFIKEVMANDFNVLSILKDQIKAVPGKDGKDIAYKVSTDPNEKGANIIKYVDPDGDGSYTPEFTPEQKKAAEDFITARFIGMIDRKETSQIVSQVSRDEQSQASNDKELTDEYSGLVGTAAGNMLSGNAQQAEDGREFFENYQTSDGKKVFEYVVIDNDGFLRMKNAATGDVYEFNLNDKDKRLALTKLYSTIGNVTGAGNSDYYLRKAMQAGGPSVTKIAGGKIPAKAPEAPKGLPSDAFLVDIVYNDPEATAENLMAKLPKNKGYTINRDLGVLSGVGYPSDIIQIIQELPDGTIIRSREFDINNEKEAKAASAGIAAFVNEREKEAQQAGQQAGQQGGTAPAAPRAANSGGRPR
jgi:hypothetical protein